MKAGVFALALLVAGCNTAERWTKRGDALLRDGDPIGAERAYNAALSVDAHSAPALYGKGFALMQSGHDSLRPVARQMFQRAIDYAPEWWGGYRGLGAWLLDEGQPLAAEKHLRRAWELDRTEPTVLVSLGQLYLQVGRFDDARSMFEAAIATAPERGEFLRYLADLAVAQRRFDDAFAVLDEARGRSLSGRAALTLVEEGEIHARLAHAEALLASASSPAEASFGTALQALDRADTLLEARAMAGARMPDLEARRRFHRELRRRIEEARKS